MTSTTVVLDTSVLLADRDAVLAYPDAEVVIPVAVVKELSRMTHDLTLGSSAVTAIEWIDSLGAGGPIKQVPTKGAAVTLEVNNIDAANLPVSLRDNPILAVAHNYAQSKAEVTFVSNDAARRTFARSIGLRVAPHHGHEPKQIHAVPAETTHLVDSDITSLHRDNEVPLPGELEGLPYNSVVAVRPLSEPDASPTYAIIRPSSSPHRRSLHRVRLNRRFWDVTGHNLEQKIAMHLLAPESGCDIVALSGPAGTGKSLIAYATGLHGCQETRTYSKMLVVRSIYAVGGQRQGFLPGTEQEKMAPWMQAIRDTLEVCAEPETIDHAIETGLIECQAPTFMRGRTLNSRFVVIDEAQNLDYDVLRTLLSRAGDGTKVVLCYDSSQCDNIAVNPADGISKVVDRLTDDPHFGAVQLTDVQRGTVARVVAERL